MGGLGSGRHIYGGRDTVEQHHYLDVNRLNREGCLRPGFAGSAQWSRGGQPVGGIGVGAEAGRLVLSYRCRRPGQEWEEVEQPAPLVWVPCRFGGERPYFRCPGVVNGRACGRQVVKLLSAGRYFLCRHCYDLRYASQRENLWDRALQKADKIRIRLGGQAAGDSPFPRRPRGMWSRTL